MLIGRTVLGEVSRNFVASLTATTGVAFFVLSITFLKRTPGVGMSFLVEVFPLFFPLALQFTVPLAVLTAVTLTFGRMQGDGELTALSASGVKPMTVVRPVLAGAAVIALAALLLTDTLAPFAAARLQAAKRDVIHRLHTSFRSGLSDLELGHGRISFESFDGRDFIDVCLEWAEDDEKTLLYRAQRGSIAVTDDDEVILTLRNARGVLPHEIKQGEWQGTLKTITIAASLDEITGARLVQRKRQDMRAWELAHVARRGIPREDRLRISSDDAAEEVARRSALAASAFFFALIGVPLGILVGGTGRSGAFLVSVAPVLVIYFPLVLWASSKARHGQLPAYPALWIGNAVLALVGFLLLRRMGRR